MDALRVDPVHDAWCPETGDFYGGSGPFLRPCKNLRGLWTVKYTPSGELEHHGHMTFGLHDRPWDASVCTERVFTLSAPLSLIRGSCWMSCFASRAWCFWSWAYLACFEHFHTMRWLPWVPENVPPRSAHKPWVLCVSAHLERQQTLFFWFCSYQSLLKWGQRVLDGLQPPVPRSCSLECVAGIRGPHQIYEGRDKTFLI